MTSSQNKIHVIDITSEYTVDMLAVNHFTNDVFTCSEPTPTQLQEGVVVSKKNKPMYKSICEDTDVFVLLTAYALKYSIESLVLMEAFASNRSVVDINKPAIKNAEIVPSLIAAHALSGCDSVPKMLGIVKKKIVSVLQQGFH